MIGQVARHFEAGWQVWRWTETVDDMGGVVKAWALQTTISGRMRGLSGDKRFSADKETFFGDHRFYCFPADIQEGDELRRGGRTFKVHFANDVMTFDRFMQVDCELIQ